MAQSQLPVRIESITRAILLLRGQRIILDAELAALYGITTKRLNEQVKRNAARFPADFMFRLSRAETEAMNRSRFATGSQKHRNPKFPPHAFTEHGAIMAAAVLSSSRAVQLSVYVVRAFVHLRELLASRPANSMNWSASISTTTRRSPPIWRRSNRIHNLPVNPVGASAKQRDALTALVGHDNLVKTIAPRTPQLRGLGSQLVALARR